MIRVIDFEPQLASFLHETYALLKSSNFTVHPAVSRVVLHGSRGPAGGHRFDSDIDLSLIADTPSGVVMSELQPLLHDILATTLGNWQSPLEADLAVVFDIHNCGLQCFERTAWDEQFCALGSVDCFGIYKIQRGFNGFVVNAGVQVKRMYPCLKIWQRS